VPIPNPAGTKLNTANSVLDNSLIGIYTSNGGIQSYVATISL
jgi:hypothetical protein